MALDATIVVREYLNPTAGTPISVDIALDAQDEVQVWFGGGEGEQAVLNEDYAVSLQTDNLSFTLTPLASLITKLGSSTRIIVRRELPSITTLTAATAANTSILENEANRAVQRHAQLVEGLARGLQFPKTFAGAAPRLNFEGDLSEKVLAFNVAGDTVGVGPTVADIAAAASNAATAAQAAADAILAANSAQTVDASSRYTTRQWIDGDAGNTLPGRIVTQGYEFIGDRGDGGVWVKVGSEPAHDCKFEFTDGTDTSWYELTPTFIITPEMMGLVGNEAVDQSGLLNATARRAVALQIIFSTRGRYGLAKSFQPDGRLQWNCGSQTSLRYVAGTAVTEFEECIHAPVGSLEPEGSGNYAFMDMRNMSGSRVVGALSLQGDPQGAANTDSRSVPAGLVGWTSTSGFSSTYSVWDVIEAIGFDYGMYQGDNRGRQTAGHVGVPTLPYTRVIVSVIRIQFCRVAIRTGRAGNGLDEAFFINFFISRCWEQSIIRACVFQGGSLFMNGLSQEKDQETLGTEGVDLRNVTGDTSEGASNQFRLSENKAAFEVGKLVQIEDAAENKTGGARWFTARITARSGTLITVSKDIPRSVTEAKLVLDNEAGMLIEVAAIDFRRTFVEELFGVCLELNNRGRVSGTPQNSTGTYADLHDVLFTMLPTTSASVVCNIANDGVNNKNIRYVVGFASLRDTSTNEFNAGTVELGMTRRKGEENVLSDPCGVIELDSDLVPAGYASAPEFHNPHLQMRARLNGSDVVYKPWNSATPAFVETFTRRMRMTRVATIADVSGQANITDNTDDTYTKTAGTNGFIEIDCDPETKYMAAVRFSALTAGTPELRSHDSVAPGYVGEQVKLTRKADDLEVFIETGEDADTIRVFFTSSDAGTITKFDLYAVESVG